MCNKREFFRFSPVQVRMGNVSVREEYKEGVSTRVTRIKGLLCAYDATF